ncbi:unnamed protein product [Effrenium voratum]|nr:unnamed protein product [Effrenium voratum]
MLCTLVGKSPASLRSLSKLSRAIPVQRRFLWLAESQFRGAAAPLRSMPKLCFIADQATPHGQALLKLIDELPELKGLLGNTLEEFQEAELLKVDVLVLAVFAGGNAAIIPDLWPKLKQLKWIHSLAAGVDTLVPVLKALDGGEALPLTNAKGAFSRSLAEYAIAAMLHFNKQIPRLQGNRAGGVWEKFPMGELHGATVGFIGFGDIAQQTARLCRAFGMRVVAYRNSKGLEGEADEVFYASDPKAKEEVFKQSDYVVCTLPGGDSTYHACGAPEFAVMKPTAVFISMGRGSCVDEAALLEVLSAKKIVGAALDVFEQEPLPAASPLWKCETLLLSPHNADLTCTYMQLTWDIFLERLRDFESPGFKGFEQTVDKSKGY